MDAYKANRAETHARVIDDDKVATEIIRIANDRTKWSGTATALLQEVNPSGEPGFPKAANALTQRLRELKPNLAAAGVDVEFDRQGSASTKMVHITKRNVASAA